jgi:hypothetical protein
MLPILVEQWDTRLSRRPTPEIIYKGGGKEALTVDVKAQELYE